MPKLSKYENVIMFEGATRNVTVANTNVARPAALTLITSVKCLATSNSPAVNTGKENVSHILVSLVFV